MAFKELRDVSINIGNELRQISSELFTARIGEKFEDALGKKSRDVALYSSKLKLLRAKPLALTQQILEQPHDNVLHDYGDKAGWKVLEQYTVKSLTQAHTVKELITGPNTSLDPELNKRKEAIIECLWQYHNKEKHLQNLNALLKEREAEHASLRAEWDTTLGVLRDLREQQTQNEPEDRGPLYANLSKLVHKLEVMRWLIGRLVCARGNYDWLADPHCRLSKALALTRSHNTIDMFTEE